MAGFIRSLKKELCPLSGHADVFNILLGSEPNSFSEQQTKVFEGTLITQSFGQSEWFNSNCDILIM